MVAATILLVGVLGTVSMVDAASKTTTSNDQRASANALARDVIEGVRGVPYRTLSNGTLLSSLQELPGFADADAAAGWQIRRTNTLYTITVEACTVDDPKDGAGSRDATFGPFCPGTIAAGTADTKPNDYSRATVNVTWTKPGGATDSVRQSTLVNNTYRGPRVVSVDGGSDTITSGTSVTFTATVDPTPTRIDWYVDGKFQRSATSFTWQLGTAYGGGSPCTTPPSSGVPAGSYLDGTYQIGAQAFDAYGSAGPTYREIKLNRCPPLAVRGLIGGRTFVNNQIDLQWTSNVEDDIVGYYVYRSHTSSTSGFSKLNSGGCAGLLKDKDSCTDVESAQTLNKTIWYRVVAVDHVGTGTTEREGPASNTLTVTTTNNPPGTPTIYNALQYGTLFWYQVTDPDPGDTIDHYRIFRDGVLYDTADYVDGSYVLWNDEAVTGVHSYRVAAVDSRMRQGALSNEVVR